MGNGAKAAARREKVAQKKPAKGASSTKAANEAAKNIICVVCRSTFLCTSAPVTLEQHAQNKHNKSAKECFPDSDKV